MDDAYLHLEVEELTINEKFIAWAVYGKDDLRMQEWITNHQEQKIKIEEAQRIVQQLQYSSLKWDQERKDALWHRINLSTDNKSKEHQTNSIWRGLAVAASVIIAAMAIWMWPSSESTKILQTNFVQNMESTLPDKSIVWLNSKTKLTYDSSSFLSDKRTIHLDGEAQFDVVKNKGTFEVITSKGKITVLGTRFNVVDTSMLFSVSCYEGRVKVEYHDKIWILSAGKQISWNEQSGEIDSNQVQIDGNASWLKQKKYFTSTKLSEIFRDLETQFNIQMIYDSSLNDRLYTGFISLSSIENSLKSVCWPLHLQYKIEGEKVIILHDQ